MRISRRNKICRSSTIHQRTYGGLGISKYSKTFTREVGGKFWVKTNQQNTEIHWLAGTGSPRSFMQEATARSITTKIPNTNITTFMEKTKHKYFNNQDIQNNHDKMDIKKLSALVYTINMLKKPHGKTNI